jgi:hypothetical protein
MMMMMVVVSDVLHGEQWEPHFGAADVKQALWTLFEAAEACLTLVSL